MEVATGRQCLGEGEQRAEGGSFQNRGWRGIREAGSQALHRGCWQTVPVSLKGCTEAALPRRRHSQVDSDTDLEGAASAGLNSFAGLMLTGTGNRRSPQRGDSPSPPSALRVLPTSPLPEPDRERRAEQGSGLQSLSPSTTR